MREEKIAEDREKKEARSGINKSMVERRRNRGRWRKDKANKVTIRSTLEKEEKRMTGKSKRMDKEINKNVKSSIEE